jgi:membrane associated rhomboid family serine protease
MMKFLEELKLQYKIGTVNQKLVFILVAVFIVSMPFFLIYSRGALEYPNWLAITNDLDVFKYFPWTLITYSFLHHGFLHLLFNCIFLYFFGNLFFTFFNSKQFVFVYVFGVVLGGISFLGYGFFTSYPHQLVGASAGIMAVFIAVTSYSPNFMVRLPLIGNVKLWHMAAVYVIIDVFYLLAENTGGHLAHLAGALAGFVYVYFMKQGTDFASIVTTNSSKKTKHHFKKVYKNTQTVSPNIKNTNKSLTQTKIDEILDKISKSGYDSLSKEEKEFLLKANQDDV